MTPTPWTPGAQWRRLAGSVGGIDIDEVLPAHEYRFTHLDARVDGLNAHHEQRLREIEEFLAAEPGLTCWQVTTRLRWVTALAGGAWL